jgi:hypothetical protein
MDAHLYQLHLQAGERSGRDSACGQKVDYKSEDSAVRAADRLNARTGRRNPLEAYPCFWCSGWHVGRQMSLEELTSSGL